MGKKDMKDSNEPAKKVRRLNDSLPIPSLPAKSGILLVCGQGDMGQLGLGEDIMERKRPTVIPNVSDVVSIVAGGVHSLCLTKGGKVFSFGCNDEGALGRDSSEEGSDFTPGLVQLPDKCVKISAGDSHSACLLADGRVFAWGSFRDSHGNMGLTLEGNKRLPIEVLPNILSADIASGADHLVILTVTGRVYTMGCAEQGQLGRVSLRSASGQTRRGKTELLKPEGVFIRGSKKVDAIWASTYCTFLREAGQDKILAFGLNNYCQLGIQKQKSELVICPTKAPFTDVKKITGGQHHTLILSNENKCYAIGRRDYGRLGIGEVSEDITSNKLITSLEDKDIVDICCGEAQSFALTKDGDLYAWGMGSNLQLGTGEENDEILPVLIKSKQIDGKKIIKVSSGGQHSMFLIEGERNETNGQTHSEIAKKTTTITTTKPTTSQVKLTDNEVTEDADDDENDVPETAEGSVDVKVEEEIKSNDAAPPAKRKRKKKN